MVGLRTGSSVTFEKNDNALKEEDKGGRYGRTEEGVDRSLG